MTALLRYDRLGSTKVASGSTGRAGDNGRRVSRLLGEILSDTYLLS